MTSRYIELFAHNIALDTRANHTVHSPLHHSTRSWSSSSSTNIISGSSGSNAIVSESQFAGDTKLCNIMVAHSYTQSITHIHTNTKNERQNINVFDCICTCCACNGIQHGHTRTRTHQIAFHTSIWVSVGEPFSYRREYIEYYMSVCMSV